MFYSSHVLTKKGPLAKIWLAAHMQSKLTKAMIFATDITKAVDSIFSPDAPMALRLTSNLLLGVVRILFRKTKYLLQESSDALAKLKTTYRPTTRSAASRDLPPASAAASFAATTLAAPHPTAFDLPAPAVDLAHLRKRRRPGPPAPHAYLAADKDITIHEFAGGLSGGILDAFADDARDFPDDADGFHPLADPDGDAIEPLVFTPSQRFRPRDKSAANTPSVRDAPASVEIDRAAPERTSPAEQDVPVLSVERDGGPDADADLDRIETPHETRRAETRDPQSPLAMDMDDVSPQKPLRSVSPQRLADSDHPMPAPHDDKDLDDSQSRAPSSVGIDHRMDDNMAADDNGPSPAAALRISTGGDDLELAEDDEQQQQRGGDEEIGTQADQEQEEAPTQTPADGIDGPVVKKRGRKRKRVLVEDESPEMSVEAFRACLNDTSDLVLQPGARRRGVDRARGRRPMKYEELLARPTMALAPQLSELFAENFRIDGPAQVGSPMSDGDLENKEGDKGRDAGAEEDADENRHEMQTPEKPVAPPKPIKEVVADPEITPQRTTDDEGHLVVSQSAVKDDGGDVLSRHTDDVPSSPVHDDMPEQEVVDRRSSLGTDAVPMPLEEDSVFVDLARGLDLDKKISLQDVAETRAQVANGAETQTNGGQAEDVTENTISARTHKMQDYIRAHLEEDGELNFSQKLSTENNVSRRTVSRSFYELLNLSTKKALQLSQDGPYGTIRAKPLQPVFDSLAKNGTA